MNKLIGKKFKNQPDQIMQLINGLLLLLLVSPVQKNPL